MEEVRIVYDIWSVLWPLHIVYVFEDHLVYFGGYSVYFFTFWYVVPRKIWQPCSDVEDFEGLSHGDDQVCGNQHNKNNRSIQFHRP
jgi:hypothetical protein